MRTRIPQAPRAVRKAMRRAMMRAVIVEAILAVALAGDLKEKLMRRYSLAADALSMSC